MVGKRGLIGQSQSTPYADKAYRFSNEQAIVFADMP